MRAYSGPRPVLRMSGVGRFFVLLLTAVLVVALVMSIVQTVWLHRTSSDVRARARGL